MVTTNHWLRSIETCMCLYVAKCNLGWVKIEPMLVSGNCGSCALTWHTGFKLQMTRARSRRLCSSFELQIVPWCGSLPLPLPSLFAGLGEYRGWSVSPLSFSVWRCMVVVATLWVAVDTCAPSLWLAFRLAPPPAFIGTVSICGSPWV